MKIKTSDLVGPALDWAVAKCEGYSDYLNTRYLHERRYSTNWSQGGPLIEREGIWTRTTDEGTDDPSCLWKAELPYCAVEVGPTSLIAAMRCYVASKPGNCVEIPDELCKA